MSDDIFLSKMRDVGRLSEKYHTAKFSKFLDARQICLLNKSGINGTLFGGYPEAERCIFGVFPDWQEPELSLFPIKVLKITKKCEKEISHRHFLGTILSLGIERDKIGDILTDEKYALVFVSEDIAEFIKSNITKVAGCGVSIDIADAEDVVLPEKKYEIIPCICASLRLDSVISGLLRKSRNDAKNLILSGKVSVNHFAAQRIDLTVKTGDLLSVRGFGRAEVSEIGEKTRSDRLHISFKKYI